MRTLLGLTGLAAFTAFCTAVISPPSGVDTSAATVETQVLPAPSVIHVKRYVQLQPGQTAPPQSVVQAAPAATPRVVVITRTRQSGLP